MFLNVDIGRLVDWHLESNLSAKDDGKGFILRVPKALGGNAEDQWIWKGRIPTTVALPFSENKSSPSPSNRLPINHHQVLADITAEMSAGGLTTEKDLADYPNNIIKSNQTHWPPLNTTQLSTQLASFHTEISTLKPPMIMSNSTTPSSLNLTPNVYSTFSATLHNTTFRAASPTQEEKVIDHFPTSTDIWPSAQLNDNFLPSFPKTPSDVDTNNLRLTDMNEHNITNIGENVYEPYVAIASILIVLLIISIIGNFLILFTILGKNYLRRTFLVLYVSLAGSDVLASIMCVPVLALIILRPHILPPEVCSFITAAFVLTIYTSVGSVTSISAIRWWQFYNFTQTKTHEKTVVRFLIFALWMTGFGIIMGFVSKDLIKQDKYCSLGHVTYVLQNLLPVAVFTISFGLCTVVIVNGLTMSKIKQKSIYSSEHQLTPRQAFVKFSRLVGYPFTFSSAEINDNHDSNVMGIEDNEKKNRITHINHRVRKKKKINKSAKGNSNWELIKQVHKPCSVPNPSGHREKGYTGKSLTISTSTKTTESKYETHVTMNEEPNTFQDGNISLHRNHAMKDPQDSFSDIESEYLQEVKEPDDNQEHLTSSEAAACHNATESFISLPNTVENQHKHEHVIMKHETTIINPVSPPNKHGSATAWKLSRLPKIHFTKENSTAEPTLKTPVEQVPSNESQMKSPWPLLQSPLAKGQCHETNCNNLLCREIHKLRELPDMSKEDKAHLTTYFPPLEVQDSLCAGYMADLSAPSSKHSTPNRKYRKRQISHRCSAKANLLSAGESDDGSQHAHNEQNSSVISRAGKSVHYHSCSKPSDERHCPSEDLAIHPVRVKCVRTCQRLIGLYSVVYLPLLLLHIPVLFTPPDMLVLFTVMYIVFLQAIHASLYILQSPILKNAIQKLVKRLLFPSKTTLAKKNTDLNGEVQRNPFDSNLFEIPTVIEQESTERPSSEPLQSQKQLSSPRKFCRPLSH